MEKDLKKSTKKLEKWRGKKIDEYKKYQRRKGMKYDPDKSLKFLASLHGKNLEDMRMDIQFYKKEAKLKKMKKFLYEQRKNRKEQPEEGTSMGT
jgi:hypothetical protein